MPLDMVKDSSYLIVALILSILSTRNMGKSNYFVCRLRLDVWTRTFLTYIADGINYLLASNCICSVKEVLLLNLVPRSNSPELQLLGNIKM